MARTAREPLVQFIAIALVLFGANQLINGDDQQRSDKSITISQGRVQQIADSYRLLSGRLPSRAELQMLVNDFADEEIAYREALALGLDVDDTIVRRRMRQKLEFLAEDAEAIEAPTDAQLAAWLREHAAAYRLAERLSFRQVMASSDTHGTRARAKGEVFEKSADKLLSLKAKQEVVVVGKPSLDPDGNLYIEATKIYVAQ